MKKILEMMNNFIICYINEMYEEVKDLIRKEEEYLEWEKKWKKDDEIRCIKGEVVNVYEKILEDVCKDIKC